MTPQHIIDAIGHWETLNRQRALDGQPLLPYPLSGPAWQPLPEDEEEEEAIERLPPGQHLLIRAMQRLTEGR